ncbi:MAG: CDP-paratose 2-epimerase [Calditrichaeota bacterium]|nr:MAG: CDP-paratose 2-epimerase [Calditrichota bacterium]
MQPKEFVFKETTVIPAPLQEVFAFFSKPENLQRLTPEFLRFRIVSIPPEIKPGARIEYRLRIHRFPVKWLTEITVWEPPHRFVDTQLKGPYRKWVHEHRFEALDGSTRMTDTVQYQLPLGILGHLAHRLYVRKDIETIFQYRREVIQKYFSSERGRL